MSRAARFETNDYALDAPEPVTKGAIYSEPDEKAVLGCLIMDDATLTQRLDDFREADFFVPAHKRLFREICRLHDAGDLVSTEKLVSPPLPDDPGNRELIAECLSNGVVALFDRHAAVLKRDSLRRRRLEELEIERQRIQEEPTCLSNEADGLVARDASELAGDDSITEPPVLVAGMLHKGSALLLGAASKSFKSWSLIDLAISVAAGAPWWSLPCTQGKVPLRRFRADAVLLEKAGHGDRRCAADRASQVSG